MLLTALLCALFCTPVAATYVETSNGVWTCRTDRGRYIESHNQFDTGIYTNGTISGTAATPSDLKECKNAVGAFVCCVGISFAGSFCGEKLTGERVL